MGQYDGILLLWMAYFCLCIWCSHLLSVYPIDLRLHTVSNQVLLTIEILKNLQNNTLNNSLKRILIDLFPNFFEKIQLWPYQNSHLELYNFLPVTIQRPLSKKFQNTPYFIQSKKINEFCKCSNFGNFENFN